MSFISFKFKLSFICMNSKTIIVEINIQTFIESKSPEINKAYERWCQKLRISQKNFNVKTYFE